MYYMQFTDLLKAVYYGEMTEEEAEALAIEILEG